jgi:hypothetical protein
MLFRKKEYTGWIKSETCWVVETPSRKAPIIGIIIQKAAITVKDVGKGWAEIVIAPVRSLKKGEDGKLIEGKGLYIERRCITKKPPYKW